MSREAPVRFWEGLGVRFPGPTQPSAPRFRFGCGFKNEQRDIVKMPRCYVVLSRHPFEQPILTSQNSSLSWLAEFQAYSSEPIFWISTQNSGK